MKTKPRGQNSFIAPHAYFEFQFDLFFISEKDLENQENKIGALMIDVFSKYMVVIPIKSKSEGDIASALIEGINKMGKSPQLLYTDDEPALNTKAIQDYLKEQKIEHHRTRGHANFSERAIRTYKKMLFDRIEADEKKGKQNIQWIDYNLEILLTYNNKMVSSATKFTPIEARKPRNEFAVKLNLSLQAKKNRVYPEIDTGDEVKVMRKKDTGEKEKSSHWLKNKQTITKIEKKLGQHYYYLDNGNKPFLRHELLKV